MFDIFLTCLRRNGQKIDINLNKCAKVANGVNVKITKLLLCT